MPAAERYLVVHEASDAVVNVILWDGETEWECPSGCSVELEAASTREMPRAWDDEET